MSIFAKKGPGFTSSPVFGPIQRSRAGAIQAETEILNFTKHSFEGKHVKVAFTAASTIGLGGAPGLTVNLDPAAVSAPLAHAGAKVVGEKIRGISRTIKPSTKKYREAAKAAYKRGAGWAVERYRSHAPGDANSDRLFNDSGGLGATVRAVLGATNGWDIVANTPGVRNQFVVRALLKREIPEIRTAAALKKEPAVQAALGEAAKIAVSRPTKRTSVFGKTAGKGRIRK